MGGKSRLLELLWRKLPVPPSPSVLSPFDDWSLSSAVRSAVYITQALAFDITMVSPLDCQFAE